MCENGFACSALDHHLDPDRAGTEGDFSTMSVKVPPPSTPMRQGATRGAWDTGHAGRAELSGHCSGRRP